MGTGSQGGSQPGKSLVNVKLRCLKSVYTRLREIAAFTVTVTYVRVPDQGFSPPLVSGKMAVCNWFCHFLWFSHQLTAHACITKKLSLSLRLSLSVVSAARSALYAHGLRDVDCHKQYKMQGGVKPLQPHAVVWGTSLSCTRQGAKQRNVGW